MIDIFTRTSLDRFMYLFLISLFEISTVAFSQHSEFRMGLDESLVTLRC